RTALSTRAGLACTIVSIVLATSFESPGPTRSAGYGDAREDTDLGETSGAGRRRDRIGRQMKQLSRDDVASAERSRPLEPNPAGQVRQSGDFQDHREEAAGRQFDGGIGWRVLAHLRYPGYEQANAGGVAMEPVLAGERR